MRAEAGFGAGRDDHIVEAAPIGPPVEDEGLVGQVLEREARAADQRMACREGSHHESGIAAALERWFTPAFRAARPDVIAGVRRRMERNDLAAYGAAYGLFATADRELAGRIGDITIPTTVVTGADDRRSSAAMALAMAERLPHGRCHIIPGQRHMTPLEVPDLVAALIAGRPLAADTHIAAQ